MRAVEIFGYTTLVPSDAYQELLIDLEKTPQSWTSLDALLLTTTLPLLSIHNYMIFARSSGDNSLKQVLLMLTFSQ